jgi:hypothetical protein
MAAYTFLAIHFHNILKFLLRIMYSYIRLGQFRDCIHRSLGITLCLLCSLEMCQCTLRTNIVA